MQVKEPLIPRHGGFRNLLSFRIAQLVYDVTARFCELYIDRCSRTRDQMVQAARSGVQNIAEGSQASGTSKKTELKLTNVARASLEELRLDYEDFLRQRELPMLAPSHPALQRFRARRCSRIEEFRAWLAEEVRGGHGHTDEHGRTPTDTDSQTGAGSPAGTGTDTRTSTDSQTSTDEHRQPRTDSDNPGTPVVRESPCSSVPVRESVSVPVRESVSVPTLAANAALSLINLACHLLDRQLAAQAKAFEQEGGFTERLYRVRNAARKGPW